MKRWIRLAVLSLIFVLAAGGIKAGAITIGELLGWESSGDDQPEAEDYYETLEVEEDGYYDTKDEVCAYLVRFHCLPPNYMKKKEARQRGWESGALDRVLVGRSIGGDVFGNYEEVLPDVDGRIYHECDIGTVGKGGRGACRIVYSGDDDNGDWNIYYTDDHYETFELLWGSDDE